MSITVEFKDFNEMVEFAKVLLNQQVTPETKAEEPEDLKSLTVKELREYANDLEVDLPNNARKLDIVNAIENAHQEVPVGAEELTEPEPEEATEEEPETEAKQTSLTIEDVRELFVEKNNIRGNTAKLKAILTEFKVKKVTDLEEKDFEAVLGKLKEL